MIKFLKYALAYVTLKNTAHFASGRLIFPTENVGYNWPKFINFFSEKKMEKELETMLLIVAGIFLFCGGKK